MRSLHARAVAARRALAVAAGSLVFMGLSVMGPPPPPPNFSPSPDVGWIAAGGMFIPPAHGPRPVTSDPAYPYSEGEILDFFVRDSKPHEGPVQPTFPVADIDNPILMPWVKEELKNQNEAVLAGKGGFGRQVACWPMGVPGF